LLLPRGVRRGAAIALALCAQWLAAGLVQSVYSALQLTIAPASFTWVAQRLVFWLYEHRIATGFLDAIYVPLLHDAVGPLARVWGWTIALFAIAFTLLFLRWARALVAGRDAASTARPARWGFAAYALAMMVFALMLIIAGRYMDIPLPHALLPLGAAFTLWCIARLQPGIAAQRCALTAPGDAFGRRAVWLLPLAAAGCLWSEAAAMLGGADFVALHPGREAQIPLIARSILANHELLLWCAANVLLALAYAWSLRVTRRASDVAR